LYFKERLFICKFHDFNPFKRYLNAVSLFKRRLLKDLNVKGKFRKGF
jgi:hypothetical protein